MEHVNGFRCIGIEFANSVFILVSFVITKPTEDVGILFRCLLAWLHHALMACFFTLDGGSGSFFLRKIFSSGYKCK